MPTKPPSLFRTWPFIMLCLSAISAVILYSFRARLSNQPWYFAAVGLTAAMAIIPLRGWAHASFEKPTKSGWNHILLFGFMCLFTGAGAYYMGAILRDWKLALGLAAISGICGYATLATRYQWPGFRTPAEPWECTRCRYDLSGNESGVCPECGLRFDDEASSGEK